MPLLRPPFLHQQCRRLVAATRMQCRIVANVHRVHLLPAPLLTCHHAESAGSKHMSKGQGRRAYMDTVTATTSSSSVKPKLVSTCREGSHLGGRTKIRPSSDPQVGERQGTDLLVPYHPLMYFRTVHDKNVYTCLP